MSRFFEHSPLTKSIAKKPLATVETKHISPENQSENRHGNSIGKNDINPLNAKIRSLNTKCKRITNCRAIALMLQSSIRVNHKDEIKRSKSKKRVNRYKRQRKASKVAKYGVNRALFTYAIKIDANTIGINTIGLNDIRQIGFIKSNLPKSRVNPCKIDFEKLKALQGQ